MLKFFDAIGVGGKYRYPALAAAGLLTAGVFVITHGTPGAQASADLSCSSYKVAQIVGDIVRKRLFGDEAGQALKASLDEDRFGGQLLDVVTENEKPLTCSADFVPAVHVTKAFLSTVADKGDDAAGQARSVEKEIDEKYTSRLRYNVKHTDDGRLYVEVTKGLAIYDE